MRIYLIFKKIYLICKLSWNKFFSLLKDALEFWEKRQITAHVINLQSWIFPKEQICHKALTYGIFVPSYSFSACFCTSVAGPSLKLLSWPANFFKDPYKFIWINCNFRVKTILVKESIPHNIFCFMFWPTYEKGCVAMVW